MRLYSGTSSQFITDTIHNQIAFKLKEAFFAEYGFNPSPSEMHSWQNSLRAVSQVFENANLKDHGVILEYQLPLSSLRLDCLVTGQKDKNTDMAVIIELKQWQRCSPSKGEQEVVTMLGGMERDVLHPSAQVGQYCMYLQDTHTAFYEGDNPVKLKACAYLHNYSFEYQDCLLWSKFRKLYNNYPLFSGDDVDSLSNFLSSYLYKGNGIDVLRRIEKGKYRPSKKLMEHVASVIEGKPEYILLDEQLVAFDKVMSLAKKGFHDKSKSVVVVKGGPGTGKSVIALKLMSSLLSQNYNAHYATGSRAFTETLRKVIGRRGAVQFKYFNSYKQAQRNAIDVLICDEAHRIRENSNSRYTPRNSRSDKPQIIELINAAKVCVFFVDEEQVVRPGEIGKINYIFKTAKGCNCNLSEYELGIQFRCGGSDAFVKWIENTLSIRRTANAIWFGNEGFDFQIFDSPFTLENVIRKKASEGYSSRMAAGFCWKWSKKIKDDGTLVDDVVIGDYRRPWNARPEARKLASGIPKSNLWATEPGGINQIGCIYTAQGFEFDYIGVIFGNDLGYNFDQQNWIGNPANSGDPVVKRSHNFIAHVKNTYRVLLSRGIKGCYIYFMDKDTERFFKSRMEIQKKEDIHVDIERKPEIVKFVNSLPVLDLRAAANGKYDLLSGSFGDGVNEKFIEVDGGPFKRDQFLVYAEGDSMEPDITDGSLCLFQRDPGGSRNGKIVLCRIEGFAGQSPLALIKRYFSQRIATEEGFGEAQKIILRSTNPKHKPIVLEEGDQYSIIGIFKRVIKGGIKPEKISGIYKAIENIKKTSLKKAILHRYDNKPDIIAVEKNGCSEVFKRAKDNDFDLVVIIPTRNANTDFSLYGDAISEQYIPKQSKYWQGRPDKYAYRIDMKNIKHTSLGNVRKAVESTGTNWLGAWTVRVVMLDENLL